MFTLTILFIVYNVSVEFVVIYRPHPVCLSIDRFGLIFAKTGSIKVGHRVQCVLFRGTDGTGTTEKTSEVRNSLTGPERLLIYVGDDEWPMLIANSTVHIFQNSRSLIT